MNKLFKFLLKVLAKTSTYRDYAETILEVSKVFFEEVTDFIELLVEEQQVIIDEAKDMDEPVEVVESLKMDAAFKVDELTVERFSSSPTYIPGFVRRAIRDAAAYITNHPTGDVRNDRAHTFGIFREHDPEELKDAVDKLNKGFTDR